MRITLEHRKKYADLQIQAMLLDMQVDVEDWTLVPKSKPAEPWLTRWKDKINEGDEGAESPSQNLGVDNE